MYTAENTENIAEILMGGSINTTTFVSLIVLIKWHELHCMAVIIE